MDKLIGYISSGVGMPRKKHKKSAVSGNLLLTSECDSSDDDYIPPKIKKKKISSKSSTIEPNQEPGTILTSQHKTVVLDTAKGQRYTQSGARVQISQLPEELVLKIFQLVIADTKQGLRSLIRASKVCRQWRRVAYDPSLWSRLDLSYGWVVSPLKAINSLAKEGRTVYLQHLSVSRSTQVNYHFIQVLVDQFSKLRSLDVSSCPNLSAKSLQLIASRLHDLEHLYASEIQLTCGREKAISNIMKTNQRNMRTLDLSTEKKCISSATALFKALSEMSRLSTLDISGIGCPNSNLLFKTLKVLAPTLEVLRMSCTFVVNAQMNSLEQSISYPSLVEFTAAAASKESRMCLAHILENADCVKYIDVRGWCSPELSFLQQGSCHLLSQLRTLNLRHVHVLPSAPLNLSKVSESLEDLDISWMKGIVCNSASFAAFFASIMPASRLRSLYCAGTHITMGQLKFILNRCSQLQRLDIESCRNLRRGLKRFYSSPDELRSLRSQI